MRINAAAAIFATAAAASLLGCSRYDSLAIGEALTIADSNRKASASPAAVLEVGSGSGAAGENGTTFYEARGRALMGPERQQIAAMAGLSRIRWVGTHSALIASGDLGFGLEHNRGSVFAEPIFHVRLGPGFVLRNETEREPPWNPWEAEQRHVPEADRIHLPRVIVQKRRMLTLTTTADAELRFTRDPLYVFGLLIGITDVVERRIGDR